MHLVEHLEKRSLLSAAISQQILASLPDETLGVEGKGEYIVQRPEQVMVDVPTSRNPRIPGFQIDVVFGSGLTASQQAVFTTAADRWEQILTGDIPDVGSGPWGAAVDDLRISASAPFIDGVGGILGQAGPNYVRGGSSLPFTGVMQFDSADVASLESSGQLDEVIIHEMGHVLGLGTIWDNLGLISGEGGSNPLFVGTQASAESNAARKTASSSVLVENTGGAGTRDGHWRESTFNNELMTGWLNWGQLNPISRITAAQYADIGYPAVNVDAADPFVPPGGNALPTVGTLAADRDPVQLGTDLTLTLSSASDSDGIANVKFYREANGIAGLQTTLGDVLIGTDTTAGYAQTFSTAGLSLGSSTFYARATDTWGAVSSVATATVSLQNIAVPAAPSTPDLANASDSGSSNTDNITNNAKPSFTGTAEANSTVKLYANGSVVGSAAANAAGAYTVAPTNPLADGTYSFTATASGSGGEGPASSGLSVRIDLAAPTLATPLFNYLTSQNVQFTFSEAVSPSPTAANVTVVNLATPGSPIPTAQMSVAYAGSTATVTFPGFGGILPDANYHASLSPAGINDLAGNPLASGGAGVDFYVLAGDANRDRKVDVGDLGVLASNWQVFGRNFGQGDFNYNNAVEVGDLGILASNWQKQLLPPAAPEAPAALAAGTESIFRPARRTSLIDDIAPAAEQML